MYEPIIAFDEAGNTGQNLLDTDQPVFSLASVHFAEEEVNELLSLFNTKSEELHFKRLRRYPKTRAQLIKFCDHDLITFSKVKYSVADKYYVTIAHIVDRLIEPVMYDFGEDIYKNGLNLAWTNMLHLMPKFFWDINLFDQMLVDFVNMIIQKSNAAIQNFYSTVERLYGSIDDNEALLSPILYSSSQIEDILKYVNKYTIDIAYPSFAVLCDWWNKELGQAFSIIHDESKPIEYWKGMIEFTANPVFMEEMEVGFDSRKMSYPLKINNLEFINSKLSRQIQISDLVASAASFTAKSVKNGKRNGFVSELLETKLFNIQYHSMWPSTKVTPEELGMTNGEGVNPLDYLAAMFLKNKGGFNDVYPKE